MKKKHKYFIKFSILINLFFSWSVFAQDTRLISEWVKCGENIDYTNSNMLAKAFSEAAHQKFILEVDCPVYIHIGRDIAKPIFIDNGTTINFTKNGKFIVDNVFIPAFVFVNTSDVLLTNWKVEYDAINPIDSFTGYYYENDKRIDQPLSQNMPQSYKFNDITLKTWMSRNRNIKFKSANPSWFGLTVSASIFYFKGSVDNITIKDMNLFVNEKSGGDKFIPCAFSFTLGEKNDAVVERSTSITETNFSIPRNLIFSNILLDGVYMGFLGTLKKSKFTNIKSLRYSDLQDSEGENIGGINKWFTPPHLFYLNFNPDLEIGLINTEIEINNVNDLGPRIGLARDKNKSENISGDARSLKIGGVNILIDNYLSNRVDGVLDLLVSDNIVIRNLNATYDSSFTNYIYTPVRFPGPLGKKINSYRNVFMHNVKLFDLAGQTEVISFPVMGHASGYNFFMVNCYLNIVDEKSISKIRNMIDSDFQKDVVTYSFIDSKTNSRKIIPK